MKKNKLSKKKQEIPATDLVQEIKELIIETRTSVAVLVNAGITRLYWMIGKRI